MHYRKTCITKLYIQLYTQRQDKKLRSSLSTT